MLTDRLKAMLVTVGVVTLSGVGFWFATPQPATRSMLELRDAGIADGQSLIVVCSERITPQTRRRINANQTLPDGGKMIRPSQQFARVARVAKCFAVDGGNCFTAATWAVRVGELDGTVIVPSLRANLIGVDLDASVADDGGDTSDAVDDADSYDKSTCIAIKCSSYDAGAAPGIPFGSTPCGALNRVWAETPPCVIPDCRTPDGGWDDYAGETGHLAAPDCRAIQATYPGSTTYVPRWNGCNTFPAAQATGTACIPVECGMVAGAGSVQDVLLGY